jgi:tRNA modification GTPase
MTSGVFSTGDTIVAIATAPGRGGIGVVRLSGPEAPRIARALCGRVEPFEPRHATLVRVIDPDAGDRPLDEVIVTWFVAPQSYTGGEVVEISGHGSPVLLERLVALAIGAGARLAEPGEFTLRAYLNGRLDLAQAEAVADLVNAVTPLQARVAMDQLEGTLTRAIARLDAALFDLVARLEASLDFPDEGFHFITRDQARADIAAVRDALDRLAQEGRTGRVVREGRLVAIAGPPNAGKSSLFNALVGAARAIVTDIPGTTRDLVTERVDVEGVPVTFVDTAGLRESGDPIEVEGVARAREAQAVAALTLFVLDRSAPCTAVERALLAAVPAPQLVVASKSDLPDGWADSPSRPGEAIEVSAVTGAGLDELRRAIRRALTSRDDWRDAPAISNLRHLALVAEARAALARAAEALAAGATEELALVDLNAARTALEAIAGRRAPDDLLQHIFARFCVGK